MTKTTHTGRGTCQVCGSLQAIDNASGIVAKHGYKVAGYGFFNGVCPGARHKPAQKDLTITHQIMAQLAEAALAHDSAAAALLAFEIVNDIALEWRFGAKRLTHYVLWDSAKPVVKTSTRGTKYNSTGDYVTHEITDKTPAHVIHREQTKAAAIESANARSARSHVKMMNEHIVPKLDQKLEPAKDVAKAIKAKAIEGIQFPTKQSRKDALDKLSREYDKARDELQDLYLALPEGNRTEAKTEVYYGPIQLNHWRPKHAEAALREFPAAVDIVARINALVAQRDVIKNAK